jgi:hypothetical protein
VIPVSLGFAIYFYLISTALLCAVLWMWWRTKEMVSWDDFQYKGRNPIKGCEFCGAKYVDSKGGRYSSCPHCHQLNEVPLGAKILEQNQRAKER